ncbi:MAG: glutamate 5-kinase [Opitutales bacterium]|nr:glutamate 5-kinase [Opitutales bacterium]MCH8541745.1 glutamate 5-kinase [Opitutales bacterium]
MLPVRPKTIVLKLGTGLLTRGGGSLNKERIAEIAGQINLLRQEGARVVVVSSGAIGLGIGALQLSRRPQKLERLQSCAAVGQGLLWQIWQESLAPFGIKIGQMLLTREDLRSRNRHLAAKSTLECLLKDGVVPLINENDSISTEEIRFGDNDILSAMVASLLRAEILFILSTAPGLVDRGGSEKVIPVVERVTPEIEALAGGTDNPLAVGGMVTKIAAARLANRSGCALYLTSGEQDGAIVSALKGKGNGTFFAPHGLPLAARKRWIAFFEKPSGTVVVDEGAKTALVSKGSSLLPVGVVQIIGSFDKGAVVEIKTANENQAFARGMVQLASKELASFLGHTSEDLKKQKPGKRRWEVVHRDALVILG